MYYNKVDDEWVASDNSENEYFVAGNLLCTRWVDNGTENREWWEISIKDGKMSWTALRANEDGSTFTATFEMNKIEENTAVKHKISDEEIVQWTSKDYKDKTGTNGIYVDLDSARRSVKQQQQIMDKFTKEYGADYAAKTVAKPGYSEHHTGLALDLYLIIDGKDITLNEEMVKYPEIWAKIHKKLADYGFILRYLEDKEHITGYGYEPWHIRYIDDTSAAKVIMSDNLTLEEYLGAVKTSDVTVVLGSSGLFTEYELKEAAVQVKCRFATFEGCELHSLRYAGDESNNEDNLAHIKENDGAVNYSQVIEFLSDFRADDKCEIFESDSEISDYQWWLAREEGGGWQLIDWGY